MNILPIFAVFGILLLIVLLSKGLAGGLALCFWLLIFAVIYFIVKLKKI